MTPVRQTKRCLDDLGLRFPPLDVPLPDAEHDLIVKAQRLPDEFASGGAERVLAIDDRVWFKVKVGEYRGAGGRVADVPDDIPPLWWLVAGGLRRVGSKDQDFYGALEVECRRAAKGMPASVSSDHLLPQTYVAIAAEGFLDPRENGVAAGSPSVMATNDRTVVVAFEWMAGKIDCPSEAFTRCYLAGTERADTHERHRRPILVGCSASSSVA